MDSKNETVDQLSQILFASITSTIQIRIKVKRGIRIHIKVIWLSLHCRMRPSFFVFADFACFIKFLLSCRLIIFCSQKSFSIHVYIFISPFSCFNFPARVLFFWLLFRFENRRRRQRQCHGILWKEGATLLAVQCSG